MSQTVYKLRHIPTGLYFEPRGCTCNASVDGKVFNRKPPRQNFWGVTHPLSKDYKESYYETPLEDWVVDEFRLTKIEKVDK